VPIKKPASKPLAEPEAGAFNLSIVAELAKIAGRHDLSEVEVEHAGLRVRVARERHAPATVAHVVAAPPAALAPAPAVAIAAPAPEAAVEPSELAGAVKSPMVGTAYLRPSPEAKPFVEVGAIVKAGEKIMLVEAMKTFNEIVAPRAGKVTHVLIEDGAPVEYGQALMVIE
jgi:acetyl-CoA carboxylase biotin carboxyl carrier protein